MVPPIHLVCANNPAVAELLGSGSVLRLYPFGGARQKDTYPYAVWQVVSGQPENYLADRANMDAITTQVDVYAKTWHSAREVAAALRAAIETKAYIVNFHGESRDPVTNSYRVSFDVDWLTAR